MGIKPCTYSSGSIALCMLPVPLNLSVIWPAKISKTHHGQIELQLYTSVSGICDSLPFCWNLRVLVWTWRVMIGLRRVFKHNPWSRCMLLPGETRWETDQCGGGIWRNGLLQLPCLQVFFTSILNSYLNLHLYTPVGVKLYPFTGSKPPGWGAAWLWTFNNMPTLLDMCFPVINA